MDGTTLAKSKSRVGCVINTGRPIPSCKLILGNYLKRNFSPAYLEAVTWAVCLAVSPPHAVQLTEVRRGSGQGTWCLLQSEAVAGQAMPGEGHGLGGMSLWVHRALLCQHQVRKGVPLGDVLEFPVKSLLGDLSLDREERCQPLATVSRDVSLSVILCCPAPGQVRTAG